LARVVGTHFNQDDELKTAMTMSKKLVDLDLYTTYVVNSSLRVNNIYALMLIFGSFS
jgi:hypothetical protein